MAVESNSNYVVTTALNKKPKTINSSTCVEQPTVTPPSDAVR